MGPTKDEIDMLDRRTRLEQVAEECGELAQACLKLIRAEGNGNPCRISKDEAMDKLIEEIADLELAVDKVTHDLVMNERPYIYETIMSTYRAKKERWIEELRDAKKGGDNDD